MRALIVAAVLAACVTPAAADDAGKRKAVAAALALAAEPAPAPRPAKLAAVEAALAGPACDGDSCPAPASAGPERFAVRVCVARERGAGCGSGTLVRSPVGTVVLTAKHVVDGAVAVSVETPDGRWFLSRVLAADPAADLAALAADDPARPGAAVADGVVPGAAVRAWGHPFGHPLPRPKEGAVVGRLALGGRTLFDPGICPHPACSGAGVFDADGKLVGVMIAARPAPGTPEQMAEQVALGLAPGTAERAAEVARFLGTLTVPKAMPAKAGRRLTLTRYTADWCGPCQVLKQTLAAAAVAARLARFEVRVHDCTADRSLSSVSAAGVTGLPTLVAADAAGTEVGRLVGAKPEAELAAWLDSLGK